MSMPLEAPELEPGDGLVAVEGGDGGDAAPAEEPPILSELARILRQYGRAYLAFVAAVTALAIALSFLLPPRYRATASLMAVGTGMPQGALGRLARIANITPSRDELPAETLVTILKSRRVSDPILDATFERWPGDPEPRPFRNLLTGTRPGKEPARDKLYRKLARSTRFRMDPETRIVSLAIETRHPFLSAQVANAYLDALNRYATSEHQSKSRLVATFIGQRIAEVEAQVADQEDKLHDFFKANQNYATTTDPDIRIEQLRLERQVELRSRIMMELVSNQEAALVEERNEAPLIQVIDRGAPPELRSWPIRRLLVGGAVGAALVLGFVLMLVADQMGVRAPRDVLTVVQ